jgi:hypothetical protein
VEPVHSAIYYLTQVQTSLILNWPKRCLPELEKIQIKYGFAGNRIGNNFFDWNFSRFRIELELKFREPLRVKSI